VPWRANKNVAAVAPENFGWPGSMQNFFLVVAVRHVFGWRHNSAAEGLVLSSFTFFLCIVVFIFNIKGDYLM